MSDDNQAVVHAVDPTCMVEAEMVAPRPPGPGFLGAIGCCLLIFAAQIGGTIAVGLAWAVVSSFRDGWPPDPDALQGAMPVTLLIATSTASTLLSGLLLAAIIYGWQTPRRLALRNASTIQWVAVVLTVLPLSLVASELTNWVALFVPHFGAGDMFIQFAQESLGAAFLFGAVLAAVGEEWWFRGIIGRGLVGRYGTVTGIGLTSLLFGLIHIDPVQGSGAMLLGIGIHGIYLATRSLYAAIVVHGLNNALAFATLAMSDRLALPGYIPGQDGKPEFTPWLLLLSALAALAGLALVLRATRTHFVLADGHHWNPGFTTAEQAPSNIDALPHNGRLRPMPLIVALLTQAAFLAALLSYAQWTN